MSKVSSEDVYQNNLKEIWSEYDKFTVKRYLQFSTFIKDGENVLDIGCNTGRGGVELKKVHPSIYLVGVELIKERLAKIPPGIYDATFDVLIQQMVGFDDFFDKIIAGEVIEHIPPEHFDSFLEACKKMLKPGGLILFTTPNPNSFLVKAGRANVFNDPSHVNIVSPRQLRPSLDRSGLRLKKTQGSGRVSEIIGSSFPLGFYGSYMSIITK